jgi:hypothetical protein
MAILTTFEVPGDPDEILAIQEEKVLPKAPELAAQNGGISNTVVQTDDGNMVVNLWESEEGIRKVADEVSPVAQEAGLEQDGWRHHEVLRHRTPENL